MKINQVYYIRYNLCRKQSFFIFHKYSLLIGNFVRTLKMSNIYIYNKIIKILNYLNTNFFIHFI